MNNWMCNNRSKLLKIYSRVNFNVNCNDYERENTCMDHVVSDSASKIVTFFFLSVFAGIYKSTRYCPFLSVRV